jgi:hypothetical protein
MMNCQDTLLSCLRPNIEQVTIDYKLHCQAMLYTELC